MTSRKINQGSLQPVYIADSDTSNPQSVYIINPTTGVVDGVRFVDENGVAYGVKQVNNKPRVSSMPYLYDIAEGNVPNHKSFHLVGYNADVDAATEDLWSVGGLYVPPASAVQLELVSSSAQDAGVVIKSGTSDSITQVGTTLTLTDAGVDFTAATAVAVGDCLLLDGDATFAIVLTVAVNVITAEVTTDEFSTSVQAYRIVDNSAGGTGIKVVKIHCLDSNYAEIDEFVVLNGLTVVTTVSSNILRVNSMYTIFAGASKEAVGNVDIRNLADTPVYRRISAGLNIDQCSFYTVPAGKTAYITQWAIGQAFSTVNRYVEARLRATCDENGHYVSGVFFIKDIILIQDSSIVLSFLLPLKLSAKTDIKIAVKCPDTNAVCAGRIEGWVES